VAVICVLSEVGIQLEVFGEGDSCQGLGPVDSLGCSGDKPRQAPSLFMVAVGTGYSPKLPLSKGSFCFHTFFPFFKFILLVYRTSADSESILLQVLTTVVNKSHIDMRSMPINNK
jgi:hypothetical protein